jgi:hypothetical protein
MTFEAILLPGGVMPANLAYGSLIEELGDDVDAIAKDLEVYAGPSRRSDTRWTTRSPAWCARRGTPVSTASTWLAIPAAVPRVWRSPPGIRSACSASR